MKHPVYFSSSPHSNSSLSSISEKEIESSDTWTPLCSPSGISFLANNESYQHVAKLVSLHRSFENRLSCSLFNFSEKRAGSGIDNCHIQYSPQFKAVIEALSDRLLNNQHLSNPLPVPTLAFISQEAPPFEPFAHLDVTSEHCGQLLDLASSEKKRVTVSNTVYDFIENGYQQRGRFVLLSGKNGNFPFAKR